MILSLKLLNITIRNEKKSKKQKSVVYWISIKKVASGQNEEQSTIEKMKSESEIVEQIALFFVRTSKYRPRLGIYFQLFELCSEWRISQCSYTLLCEIDLDAEILLG